MAHYGSEVVYPSLSKDDWDECLQSFLPVTISARDKVIHLKLLQPAYYIPYWLATIYPHMLDLCHRCDAEPGSLIHVLWMYPCLQTYWRKLSSVITPVGGLSLPVDVLIFILGIDDNLETTCCKQLFALYSAFYGKFYWDGASKPRRLLMNGRCQFLGSSH